MAKRRTPTHTTPTSMCCRRLRGSTLTQRNPWAYAHGYLLSPLRGLLESRAGVGVI